MKIIESHIVENDKNILQMLHKCDNGKPGGRWFIQTAGAFGTRDMALKPISSKKALALINPPIDAEA